MKTLLMLLSVIMLCSACIAAPLKKTSPAAKKEERIIFAEIEKATSDLAANTPKLIEMYKRTDGASSEQWNLAIAHRIPEQPIAAMQLMAKTNVPIYKVCSRELDKDALSFNEDVRWMNEAITTLGSFRLNDPKAESIRKKCLQVLQFSLANKDNWKN